MLLDFRGRQDILPIPILDRPFPITEEDWYRFSSNRIPEKCMLLRLNYTYIASCQLWTVVHASAKLPHFSLVYMRSSIRLYEHITDSIQKYVLRKKVNSTTMPRVRTWWHKRSCSESAVLIVDLCRKHMYIEKQKQNEEIAARIEWLSVAIYCIYCRNY